MGGQSLAAAAVVLSTTAACMSSAGGSPSLPGTGGGALGGLQTDAGSLPQRWVGYDAAVVSEGDAVLCDRVWDTDGVTSDLECEDCEVVVEVLAMMRDDVGAGEDCLPTSYGIAYGYRAFTTSDSLPLGLLAMQPEGWVWVGDATWDGERLVGGGRFRTDGRETVFSVVGRLLPSE